MKTTSVPHRNEILGFIHSYLKVDDIEDHCVNGLQIEGKEEISSIILGVSCSARLFEEAVQRRADMVIVHHGLFWQSDPRPFSIRDILRNRIATIMKNDINLAAYHLPLDAHPVIGNNVQLLKKLKLKFLRMIEIGCFGRTETPMDLMTLQNRIDEKLTTRSILFPFGEEKASRIFIVSGSGGSDYALAAANGADTFITGEIKENQVRLIEESHLNLFVAGHYNTEKLGIQALGEILERHFPVTCQFIDIPNPM